MADPMIFIVGPTGVGKSALGVEVAKAVGGEVASVDAFQVYRGLDVGTGKITKAEQQGVKHHLLSHVNLLEDYNVAAYLKDAGNVYDQFKRSGRSGVWVGGTGLYVRGLREGLTSAPRTDVEVLKRLEALPYDEVVDEVKRVDPEWSAGADLSNPRRVYRAVAVYQQTGKKLSEWHEEKSEGVIHEGIFIYLWEELGDLRKRVSKRIDEMVKQGWADEVNELLKIPEWKEAQSVKAIGYEQMVDYIEGRRSLNDAVAEIKVKTGQYAKRQMTWFRRDLVMPENGGSEKSVKMFSIRVGECEGLEDVLSRSLRFLGDSMSLR